MINRILPILIIVIAIGAFVGYIQPTYSKGVVPLQAQITQYDNTLTAAEDFNRREAELATQRNAIPQDAVARLVAFLPDGVDNIQLILDLNALAGRSGLRLSNFDIKGGDTGTESTPVSGTSPLESASSLVEHIDISFVASGTYSQFRTFLDGIERSLRPLDVVQLTITDAPSGIYTYNLTLRIYWLH